MRRLLPHVSLLLLRLELAGVDSLENDDRVTVTLYLGGTVDGRPPALDGPTDGSSTRVEPDQTFATVRTFVGPTEADILHGRLRVRWPFLEIPRERFGYPSRLFGAELRTRVCANGLFNGHLGGAVEVDELVAQITEGFGPGLEETSRSVAESVADLAPTADPEVCSRISAAYAIAAVPASRIP